MIYFTHQFGRDVTHPEGLQQPPGCKRWSLAVGGLNCSFTRYLFSHNFQLFALIISEIRIIVSEIFEFTRQILHTRNTHPFSSVFDEE